jgi:hypothetical protein
MFASVYAKHDARRIWRQFFDAPEYYRANPDVAIAGLPPALHYAVLGHREGREPSAGFSGRRYHEIHPDVARAGMNPLVHYAPTELARGAFEPKSPHDHGEAGPSGRRIDMPAGQRSVNTAGARMHRLFLS